MKKVIIIFCLCSTFFINAEEKIVAEPYAYEEFSPILHDVRRASIIFCGAFPLGYMYTSIIGDPILAESDMFIDLDATERSNEEIEIKLISSLIFAGTVMIIDLIIEKFFKGS